MLDWASKHRPTRLSEIVGQQVNVEILQRLVDKNELYGAMIFYGRSGCGKTTTARCLANEMQAEYIEVNAADNSSADSAREIAEMANRFALTGKHKIIVIDEAHGLSRQAWQVLLKAIEEPNSKMHWIFCTTEWRSLPDTIKGRCHMFKFYSIPREHLINHAKAILEKEHINTLPMEVLNEIIKESKGQPRDLLKSLQISAENGLDTVEKYFKWLQKPSIRGMVNYIEGVLKAKPASALMALKAVETSELVEWRRRLEDMIYEMLEDKFIERGLQSYSQPVRDKMRELTSTVETVRFGALLDKLLLVNNAEDAYRMLYVTAVQGV